MLEQGITVKAQTWGEAGTEQGIALSRLVGRKGLEGHLQAFLLSCKVDGYSPHTILDYRKKLGQFVRFAASIGVSEAEQVTVDHIRLFLLTKKEQCGPVTVYNHHRDLRVFCNWLVREKRIKESPMATLNSPRIPKTFVKPLSTDQLRQLLGLCDADTFLGLRNRAIILVFLDTAIRLSEMANMKINDIDFDRGIIRIMGKGARERVVAIQNRTKKAMLRYLLSRTDHHPCVWVTEERIPLTLKS